MKGILYKIATTYGSLALYCYFIDKKTFMQQSTYSITDEEEHSLLLHAAIHFGSNFQIMRAYYQKGGPGKTLDFCDSTLKTFCTYQKQNPHLLKTVLSHEDQHLIKKHLLQYEKLQEVYTNPPDKLSTLICDLILTEFHDPIEEIQALIPYQMQAEKRLLTILTLDTFHSPLAPGYGLAPYNAAKALGLMQSKLAIKPIFGLMHSASFDHQELLIKALRQIGQEAKKNLLKSLTFPPFTVENASAAICLAPFSPDKEIKNAAIALLQRQIPTSLREYCQPLI